MSDSFDESLQHEDGKSQEMERSEGFWSSLEVTGQAAEA
jgi:hypothetical protein